MVNIERWDAGLVREHVVVGDGRRVLEAEKVGVAELDARVPDAVERTAGPLTRDAFASEAGTFGAHHVEQHAVFGLVVGGNQVFGPVLRAQAPRRVAVALVELVFKVFLGVGLVAPVFGIEEDKIHAHGRAERVGLLSQDAGHFQGHGHGAGPVGGAVHGLVFLLGVFVGISKRAGVPVAEDGDPARGLRLVLRDDVASPNVGAVEGHSIERLLRDFEAELLQLRHQVVAAGHVRFGVGHARTKCYLPGSVGVGGVRVEGRRLEQLGRLLSAAGFGGFVVGAGGG